MAQPVIPTRPDDVPEDLTCSICFGVPLTPAITPCEHVYCDACLRQAIKLTSSCPLCRTECDTQHIQPLKKGSFVYRLWCGIPVKCAHHEQGCTWTGSVVDASAHHCTVGERIHSAAEVRQLKDEKEELQGRVEALEKENGEYKKIISQFQLTMSTQIDEVSEMSERFGHLTTSLETRVSELETLHSQLETQHSQLETEHEQLRSKYIQIKANHHHLAAHPLLKLPVLFRGSYNYDRKVATLAQLIGRYLHGCPHNVDRNKIYNCVRKCYMDFQKQPPRESLDRSRVEMRMLLTTASASQWFTENQMNNIGRFLQEQNWT